MSQIQAELQELKQENERLKGKSKSSSDKRLRKDVDSLLKQISQTNQQLTEMERRNEELTRKLDEAEEENAELKAIKEAETERASPSPSTLRAQEQTESLVRRVESDLLGKVADLNASLTAKYK